MAIRLCEPPGLTAFYTGFRTKTGDAGALETKQSFAERLRANRTTGLRKRIKGKYGPVARHRAKSTVQNNRVIECGIGASDAAVNYGQARHGVNLHHKFVPLQLTLSPTPPPIPIQTK